jgi:hypothetical protein
MIYTIILSSTRLWTFQLLGLEVFQVQLQKKDHFNRFYGDTRDFRPFEDKIDHFTV